MFESNGITVALIQEQQKGQLTDAGYIYLGSEFESELPVIRYEVPGEPGNVAVLRGFTSDARVVKLFRQFLADCQRYDDLPVGPVSLPVD